ncbi:hypothetical protein HK098_006552 [Nowakowskiella sp. JEL0407]|nr:hypothetical protein HK098_006552 [Nowakowskiella sp. JEL0407]
MITGTLSDIQQTFTSIVLFLSSHGLPSPANNSKLTSDNSATLFDSLFTVFRENSEYIFTYPPFSKIPRLSSTFQVPYALAVTQINHYISPSASAATQLQSTQTSKQLISDLFDSTGNTESNMSEYEKMVSELHERVSSWKTERDDEKKRRIRARQLRSQSKESTADMEISDDEEPQDVVFERDPRLQKSFELLQSLEIAVDCLELKCKVIKDAFLEISKHNKLVSRLKTNGDKLNEMERLIREKLKSGNKLCEKILDNHASTIVDDIVVRVIQDTASKMLPDQLHLKLETAQKSLSDVRFGSAYLHHLYTILYNQIFADYERVQQIK